MNYFFSTRFQQLTVMILTAFSFSPLLQAKTFLYETGSSNTQANAFNITLVEEKEEFVSLKKIDGIEIKGLIYRESFQIPPSLPIKSVKALSGIANYTNGALSIYGTDMMQNISLTKEDGTSLSMTIDRTNHASNIIYTGCGKDFPQALPATDEKIPFSIGIACVISSDKRKAIVLSVPESAAISSATLFDRMGKGERWRLYELIDSKSEDGIIGNIVITYNQKDYKLNLILLDTEVANLRKTVEKLREELNQLSKTHQELLLKTKSLQKTGDLMELTQLFDVYFALGSNALKLDVEKSEFGPLAINDSELAIQLYTISEPIFNHFILQSGFSSTLPTAQKTDRLDAFQIEGSLGYLLPLGSLHLIPFLSGAYRSYSHPTSTMSLQVGQIGAGLESIYHFGEEDQAGLKFGSQPAGSKILKSHTQLGLFYEHRFQSPKVWRLGGRFGTQKIGVVNDAGDPRIIQDSQFQIYLSL